MDYFGAPAIRRDAISLCAAVAPPANPAGHRCYLPISNLSNIHGRLGFKKAVTLYSLKMILVRNSIICRAPGVVCFSPFLRELP
jgi:hypothetical protein